MDGCWGGRVDDLDADLSKCFFFFFLSISLSIFPHTEIDWSICLYFFDVLTFSYAVMMGIRGHGTRSLRSLSSLFGLPLSSLRCCKIGSVPRVLRRFATYIFYVSGFPVLEVTGNGARMGWVKTLFYIFFRLYSSACSVYLPALSRVSALFRRFVFYILLCSTMVSYQQSVVKVQGVRDTDIQQTPKKGGGGATGKIGWVQSRLTQDARDAMYGMGWDASRFFFSWGLCETWHMHTQTHTLYHPSNVYRWTCNATIP